MRLDRVNSLTGQNLETTHHVEDSYISLTMEKLTLFTDEYDNLEAQRKYVKQTPPCYIILGKPGIGK